MRKKLGLLLFIFVILNIYNGCEEGRGPLSTSTPNPEPSLPVEMPPPADTEDSPETTAIDILEGYSSKIKSELANDYSIYEGTHMLYSLNICPLGISLWGNCFGANPAAPYIVPAYEMAEGEYLDLSYGEFPDIEVDGTLYRSILRYHETEARVLIVNTPPRAAYWGYQTYLFSRFGTPSSSLISSSLPDTYSPSPGRYSVFNSISNPINIFQVKEQMELENPWGGQTIAIISTADQDTATDVKNSLLNQGFEENQIFIESFAPKTMGLDSSADDFFTLMRYALPELEASKDYYENPIFKNFRVIAKNRTNTNSFEDQILDARSANDESSLSLGLLELASKVRSKVFSSSSQKFFISPISLGIDTYNCIEDRTNCLGDTRDTDTYLISVNFTLDQDETIVIVGVNHTKTENGSYVSLSINDSGYIRPSELRSNDTGLIEHSISQAGESLGFDEANRPAILEGSAERAISLLDVSLSASTLANIDKYWVKILKRPQVEGEPLSGCGNLPECFEISTETDKGVALDRKINIMRRVYIKPGTARGPDASKLLKPFIYVGSQ